MQQRPTPEPTGSASPTAVSGTPPTAGSTRRGLLAGVGLAGLAGALAACGESDGGVATGAPSGGATDGGGGAALARTSDIPVGGGKVFDDQKVVVTQPVEGTFKAFSATCTHRGCTVASVSGGTINCPCHGSKYSINDASVTAGPAPRALSAKQIVVEGGEIKLT
jgi:nitrite reductase/ring-hydroxylating ferredoxin subunit